MGWVGGYLDPLKPPPPCIYGPACLILKQMHITVLYCMKLGMKKLVVLVDHRSCLYDSAADDTTTTDQGEVVYCRAAREKSLPFSSRTIASSRESRCENLISTALYTITVFFSDTQ